MINHYPLRDFHLMYQEIKSRIMIGQLGYLQGGTESLNSEVESTEYRQCINTPPPIGNG